MNTLAVLLQHVHPTTIQAVSPMALYDVNRRGSYSSYKNVYNNRLSTNYPWDPDQVDQLNSVWELASLPHERPYGRSRGDNGGPFYLRKDTRFVNPTPYFTNSRFRGTSRPAGVYAFAESSLSNPTLLNLAAEGTTLLGRALPNAPEANLALLLGELKKDGIPSITGIRTLKTRSKMAKELASRKGTTTKRQLSQIGKNTGDEYLNLVFGWAPLIQEVQQLARQVIHSSKWISEQTTRTTEDRRRRSFPDVVTNRVVVPGTTVSLQPPVAGISARSTLASEITTKKTWFSGAFVYKVPIPNGLNGKMLYYEQQANRLLGTRITPEVLWALAPWSWAVDWFMNTSECLKAISLMGQDGMVMRYGYVMQETISVFDIHADVSYRWSTASPISEVWPTRYRRIRKIAVRQNASPYGFNVDWDGFSPYQIAVTAALGLSRFGK